LPEAVPDSLRFLNAIQATVPADKVVHVVLVSTAEKVAKSIYRLRTALKTAL
jgi:hypothetical protein